jgi:hypothetical protein
MAATPMSHALFRPTRLQFWCPDGAAPDTTVLELGLDADVRRRAEKLWIRAMARPRTPRSPRR